MIYVNAKGDILLGCDYSYTSQQKRKICTVYDDIASRLQKSKPIWDHIVNNLKVTSSLMEICA